MTRTVLCTDRMAARCEACRFRSNEAGARGCSALLPHREPPAECCRDEAFERLVELGVQDVQDELSWWESWANDRHAQVLDVLLQSLQSIAALTGRSVPDPWEDGQPVSDRNVLAAIATVAARALRRAGGAA